MRRQSVRRCLTRVPLIEAVLGPAQPEGPHLLGGAVADDLGRSLDPFESGFREQTTERSAAIRIGTVQDPELFADRIEAAEERLIRSGSSSSYTLPVRNSILAMPWTRA